MFIAPNMGCGICQQCVTGNTNLCVNYSAFGVTIDGAFAEYMRIPSAAILQGNLIPIGEEIDATVGALIEPFACVLRGQNALHIQPGEVVLIVGAGPIGIEMGQSFNRLGSEVIVVDMADQILNKEDKDMADQVMNVMKEEGVKFYLKASIVKVGQKGALKEVTLKTEKGETKKLSGETILVAVGRKPNIEGLGLENIGVDLDRRGIKVDERLRTNHKHIYGAGDAIGGYLFTHSAGYEGGIVVSNAIFHLPRKTNYTYIPWCTYTEPELANIGMNEKRANSERIKYSVWTERFESNDRSLAEGVSVGLIKLILNEKEKPIGIQILGPDAGDILSEWVAAMNGGVKLSTLASAIHPYPTLGEINKKVTGSVFAKKIFSEKVKKALKFFFSLKGRACIYYPEEKNRETA